jgi:hypothetical protein
MKLQAYKGCDPDELDAQRDQIEGTICPWCQVAPLHAVLVRPGWLVGRCGPCAHDHAGWKLKREVKRRA